MESLFSAGAGPVLPAPDALLRRASVTGFAYNAANGGCGPFCVVAAGAPLVAGVTTTCASFAAGATAIFRSGPGNGSGAGVGPVPGPAAGDVTVTMGGKDFGFGAVDDDVGV